MQSTDMHALPQLSEPQDLSLSTLTLMGDKVVVKLDSAPIQDESGIIVPKFENHETEGGRKGVQISRNNYLSKGTIVGLSKMAIDKTLEESNLQLEVGQRVFVNLAAMNNNFQFFPTRETLVLSFEGYIAIPHGLIDAIVNN